MSILWLILLIADGYAIFSVFKSSADMIAKVLWSILIFTMPFFGLLIWYLLGPKEVSKISHVSV